MGNPAAGVQITIGGTTTQIDVTDDTGQGVVNAINSKGIGISASLVNTQRLFNENRAARCPRAGQR